MVQLIRAKEMQARQRVIHSLGCRGASGPCAVLALLLYYENLREKAERKEGSICFPYFKHTRHLKFYSVSKCYWLALSEFIFPTSQRSPIWSHTNPFSVIRSKILPNGIRGATPVVNPCDKALVESSYYILYVTALESICGSRVEYWCGTHTL